LPESSKTRYDIITSTQSYDLFETILKTKTGKLAFYFGDVPDSFKFSSRDRPDKAITKKGNISSVFMPDLHFPFAYGDVNQTQDGLLIIFSNDCKTIEIFIARGQRNNKRNLYTLLCDKELDHEIELLRSRAKEL
jgi:hypothetical protein